MKWHSFIHLRASGAILFFLLLGPTQTNAQPDKGIRKPANAPAVKKPLDFMGRAITYYVNQSAPASGDGTALHPFRSITEALTNASQQHREPVVNIVTGTYREDIVITNNTLLHGITGSGLPERSLNSVIMGSVTNNGAFTVELDNLHIANSPAPGAIVVNNTGATTILNNVLIDRATRYGIYQKGGNLFLDTISVLSIAPGPVSAADKLTRIDEVICYGTGIYLNNVVADISNLILRGNVKGMMVDGAGCNVTVRGMTAEQHTVNPVLRDIVVCKDYSYRNGLGCIEAANGARLQLRSAKIQDNDFCGLSVRDGARVSGYDIVILRSNPVICPGNEKHWGVNVSVMRGGAWLELDQFELGYSVIALQLVNVNAKCSNGKIHNNTIGIYIKDPLPSFSFADLQNNMIFQDNQRNIDAANVPVPEIGVHQ